MALTKEQQKKRSGKLTASAIGALVSGDQEKILNLWRLLIGDPGYSPDDLSDVWAVQLGVTTETLNLDWYQKKTGFSVTRRGDVVTHQQVSWAACTLDGWVEELRCPIECKHVGGRESFETVLQRYVPQCQWQMDVMGSGQCVFSVIEGAREPRLEIIEHNQEFSDQLWAVANEFMECVFALTPPFELPSVEAPIKPEEFRVIDFKGNNQWADSATTWLENREAVEKCSTAEANLKAMMPRDCREAFGHGVKITRNKANRLSLKAIS